MVMGSLFEEYPTEAPAMLPETACCQQTAPAVMPACGAKVPASTELPAIPFVATDMTCCDRPDLHADDDLIIAGKAYRRLHPAYYAWMRRQMEIARERYHRGLLPEGHYSPLKARFNAMHDLAVSLFGETALLQAIADTKLSAYEPPVLRISRDAAVLRQDAVSHPGPAPLAVPCPAPDAPPTDGAATPPAPGPRVGDRAGQWAGGIIRQYPADEWFPHGWAEIRLDDGQLAQVDLRALVQADGTPMVTHPRYTADEQRAMALAHAEQPDDFMDLEASLPILSFTVPGEWRYQESVPLMDYLKVNDIRDAALALGWTDAMLFQTSGHYQFPCGQDYGLVCFLRGRTIGTVDAEYIELRPETTGQSLRFYRPHQISQEESR